jgi:hypothetical protein
MVAGRLRVVLGAALVVAITACASAEGGQVSHVIQGDTAIGPFHVYADHGHLSQAIAVFGEPATLSQTGELRRLPGSLVGARSHSYVLRWRRLPAGDRLLRPRDHHRGRMAHREGPADRRSTSAPLPVLPNHESHRRLAFTARQNGAREHLRCTRRKDRRHPR